MNVHVNIHKSCDLTVVGKDQGKGEWGPGKWDRGVYILNYFTKVADVCVTMSVSKAL